MLCENGKLVDNQIEDGDLSVDSLSRRHRAMLRPSSELTQDEYWAITHIERSVGRIVGNVEFAGARLAYPFRKLLAECAALSGDEAANAHSIQMKPPERSEFRNP